MKKSIALFFVLSISQMFGQGSETFSNCPLGSSYANGNYVGDNGVTWNYIESRDDNNDANSSGIDMPAIMLRREITEGSMLSAISGTNGVGEITMKLYKGFTSTILRQVDVYVNGTLYGTSPGFNDNAEHVYTISGINESGDVLIEIKNTKSVQIIVDDVQWSQNNLTLSVVKNEIINFSLFPNPVKEGRFVIKTSNNDPKKVQIYSLLGQKVYQNYVKSNELIDVSHLNQGFYLVRVEENGKIATRKLIVN